MLKNFRTFDLAVQLYRGCEQVQARSHLRDQLLRASSSVVLNLSEGSARNPHKDRQRFYTIAFASLREVQALIDLEESLEGLRKPADILGAHLYRLTQS